MLENKPLTDVEIEERGGGILGGITELSDEQVDAVAGGTGGTTYFQTMARKDTPMRPHAVWSICYDGCQLPPESRSLWARSVGGPADGSTKFDVKCYNCGMLYESILNANMPSYVHNA